MLEVYGLFNPEMKYYDVQFRLLLVLSLTSGAASYVVVTAQVKPHQLGAATGEAAEVGGGAGASSPATHRRGCSLYHINV